MSDNVNTTNATTENAAPQITVEQLLAALREGNLHPDAAALLRQGLRPQSQSGPIAFDSWGKIKLGGTEVSIAACCGVLELEYQTGKPLSVLLAEHVRDYRDAAQSTSSLKDNPPTKSDGSAIELRGDTRVYRGLSLGGSVSAADKTVARIRKIAGLATERLNAAQRDADRVAAEKSSEPACV